MTTAYASAAEPRHTRGGAGRVGRVRPRRPQQRALQTIDIPERIYRGHHYSDAFLKAWAKMAALDVDTNPEHCNAHVAELARFCGLSKRDFERALTEGSTPGPDGAAPEFTTQRMTRKSGVGRTAIREVRFVLEDERFVTVSVAMCDALEPRRLRAALLLAHAAKYSPGYQPTAAEMAGELFHHHGKSAGKPLSERTARRVLHDLDETGWVSLGRRAGYQGRHTVTVHRHPIHVEQLALDIDTATPEAGSAAAVDAPAPAAAVCGEASADNHGGSAAATGGGSLAIKEYTPALTDQVAQVGGSRRRRGTGSKPVENPGDLVPETFRPGPSRAPRGTRTPRPTTSNAPARPAYTGPELRWTARIRDALAPVSGELDGIRRFLLRKIAKEIGAELDADDSSSERIATRIARRRRPLLREDVRDWGAWLLAVGLPRKGCGHRDCEDGELWPTGEPCETCAYTRQLERQQWRQAREWQALLDAQRARATAAEDLPAKATFRERSAAGDEEIRAAIAQLGPVGALHRYGQLRVGPLLRTTGIQEELPGAREASLAPPRRELPAERPVPARMPDTLRAAVKRMPGHALAASCPACSAVAGQACTTPRGRTRTPHQARLDAHPAAPHLAAASGEDTV